MATGYTVVSGWQMIKVSLTSTQILSLFSSPVQILPSPGVNRAYQFLSNNFIRLNFNTTPYATNLTIAGVYDTVNKQAVMANGFIIQAPQTKTVNFLLASPASTLTVPQIVTNSPFYINVQTGNPLLGDGTLDIWITYRIIDLS